MFFNGFIFARDNLDNLETYAVHVHDATRLASGSTGRRADNSGGRFALVVDAKDLRSADTRNRVRFL